MGAYLRRRKHWQWMNRANNSGGPAALADKGRNKQSCTGSAVRRESPGVQLSAGGCLSQKESQGWAVTSAQHKGPWIKLGHLPQAEGNSDKCVVQGQTPFLVVPPRNNSQKWEVRNTAAHILSHAVQALATFGTLSSQIHHCPLSGRQQKQHLKHQSCKKL